MIVTAALGCAGITACKKKDTSKEGEKTITGTQEEILAWCRTNEKMSCPQHCPPPIECPAPPEPPPYDSREVRAGEYLISTKAINDAPKQMAEVCGEGRHGKTVWFRSVGKIGKRFVTLFTCEPNFAEVPQR
jgi:hypothetical protein